MKNLCIVTLFTLLVSSCGIFKNTKKEVNKTSGVTALDKTYEEHTVVSKGVKNTIAEVADVQESEKTKENRQTSDHATLEADEIIIDSQGNIHAKGGAKLHQQKNTKEQKQSDKSKSDNSVKISENNVQQDSVAKIDSSYHAVEKSSTKLVTSSSETSGKVLVFLFIGALVLVLGVCVYWGVFKLK